MSPTTRAHVLDLPLSQSILRLIQLVLAIILLGLAAYGLSVRSYDGLALTLFTVPHPFPLALSIFSLTKYQTLATIITVIYVNISNRVYLISYNYWAILGLDIFLVVFWLISFALVASEAKSYVQFSAEPSDCPFDDRSIHRRECFQYQNTSSSTYRNVLRVTAVFGAFELWAFLVLESGFEILG